MHCTERTRTPGRDARPLQPSAVSPDPDRTPAPAAKNVKPYQITRDGHPIPRLPSTNSRLSTEELSELPDVPHQLRDWSDDGTRPLSASKLLKGCLDTGKTPPIASPPR